MVKVKGSKGVVNVEFEGIAEVQRKIQAKEKKLLSNLDIAMLRGANLLQGEIQESITGNRAETRSVDSGKFANSISVGKEDNYTFSVFPRNIKYSGVKTTTEEVAKFLEYGTTKIQPRRHFRNSVARNRDNIVKAVRDTLKF